MTYILITIISIIMIGATVCTLSRAGEKENICNYDYMED